MHGEPALPDGFERLPYASPEARKGGRLRLAQLGAFDSLNPFNVKALSTAEGLAGNVYQTLMFRTADEPFTLYGLIAESLETDPARDFVVFHLDRRAHFSDGAPITSDDVLFSFDLLKNQGPPAGPRRLWIGSCGGSGRPANGALRPRRRQRPRAAADARPDADPVARPHRRRPLFRSDPRHSRRLRPLPGGRGHAGTRPEIRARSQFLGARPSGHARPLQFRRDRDRLLPRPECDVRGLQGGALRFQARGRRRALDDGLRLSRRAAGG